MDTPRIEQRIGTLLERVNLVDRADERVESYSRGMKQRLHIAKTLLHEPEVVILDEPSIGLDPAAAIELRQLISELVPRYTVLLATHDMHEAEVLCRELAILDKGEIVAMGSPDHLKSSVSLDRHVRIVLSQQLDETQKQDVMLELWGLPTVTRVIPGFDPTGQAAITLRCGDATRVLDGSLAVLRSAGSTVRTVDVREPSLEDVFLQATGRSFEPAAAEAA
jgi:ABC-2 type transport system ATP-binding protein